MENKKVLSLIKKVYILSEKGVGHEALAAKNQLDKLLAKYRYTVEDIINSEISKVEWKEIAYVNKYEKEIIIGILSCHDLDAYRGHSKKICFQTTVSKYIDVSEEIEYYKKLLKKDIKSFFTAFMIKYNLFKDGGNEDKENKRSMTEEEILDIVTMMKSLKSNRYNRHKMIEAGGRA